jgi:hypothetical protein
VRHGGEDSGAKLTSGSHWPAKAYTLQLGAQSEKGEKEGRDLWGEPSETNVGKRRVQGLLGPGNHRSCWQWALMAERGALGCWVKERP